MLNILNTSDSQTTKSLMPSIQVKYPLPKSDREYPLVLLLLDYQFNNSAEVFTFSFLALVGSCISQCKTVCSLYKVDLVIKEKLLFCSNTIKIKVRKSTPTSRTFVVQT